MEKHTANSLSNPHLGRETGQMGTLLVEGRLPQPAWFPAKGRYGGELFTLFSRKIGREVHLCFCLEFYHCVLLECDPLVKAYCEHPLQVKVKIEGRIVTTTFDMWVLFHDGREELREAKPQDAIDDETSQRQLAAQESWCNLSGFDHKRVTNVELEREPLLSNCRRMLGYLAQNPGSGHEQQVLARVGQDGRLPLKDLVGTTNVETQKLWHAAFHLLARGKLWAPLETVPWDRLTLENDEHAQDSVRSRQAYC